MGNPVNIFDISGESLATFLASAISDGTWSDVFETEKVDENLPTTEATAVETSVGSIWGNAVDDYILASYPLVRGALQGLGSATANAVVLWDGTSGTAVKNSVVTIDGSGNIATAGTVDGRNVSADGATLDGHVASTSNPHATTLALVLAEASGNTTGGTNVEVSNGDQIVGEDGGAIHFEATSGLIIQSSTSIGDPGSESGEVVVGATTYSAKQKIADFGDDDDVMLVLDRHSTTSPPAIVGARSRSADSAHGVVQNGDQLLSISAAGHDGTDYAFGGRMVFEVSGTPGGDDMPTKFVLSVSADGSQTPTERLTILPTGATTIAGALTVDSLITSGTVDGRDVSADGAALDAHVADTGNPHTTSLAQVMAEGSSTGANNLTITNGQAIIGQDAGSIEFTATTGLIETTAMSVGDPGTESDDIVLGGVTYSGNLKIPLFGGATSVPLIVDRHSTTLPPLIIGARSHSDTSGHTVVSNADGLLGLYAAGWDGTDYALGGSLAFEVDGTPGDGDMPTRFVLGLSTDGAESPTERLRISNAGAFTLTGGVTVTETLTVTGKNYSVVRGSTARGSANTMIYRWTSQVDSAGTDITYSDSATNGGSWLVATAGIYTVSVSQEPNAAAHVAIKAAAALSNTFNETSIKAVALGSLGSAVTLHWTGPLAANDLIWVAVSSTSDPGGTSANYRTVTVTRIY